VASSTPYHFTRDLQLGSVGQDVKALQIYLNSHGFVISLTGAGSPGHETTIFGGKTKAALIKFQKANGITPAVGYFGPITRGAVKK
jgi:peptidoglycan hydrolase-like protein with peptidoglycan-binding domain